MVLEANPALTWRDVKHILASTARQIDAARAAVDFALTDGTYVAEPAWLTNAAGFKFHNWYGFGMVDASAAVNMARTYTPGQLGTFVDTGFISSPTLDLAIPDASVAGATSTLTVPANPVRVIEAVQIRVSATHSFIGVLGIELASPSGKRSVLKNIFDGFAGSSDLEDMVLLSNAFYGESRRRMDDQSRGRDTTVDAGTLTRWSIRVSVTKSQDPTQTRGAKEMNTRIVALCLVLVDSAALGQEFREPAKAKAAERAAMLQTLQKGKQIQGSRGQYRHVPEVLAVARATHEMPQEAIARMGAGGDQVLETKGRLVLFRSTQRKAASVEGVGDRRVSSRTERAKRTFGVLTGTLVVKPKSWRTRQPSRTVTDWRRARSIRSFRPCSIARKQERISPTPQRRCRPTRASKAPTPKSSSTCACRSRRPEPGHYRPRYAMR